MAHDLTWGGAGRAAILLGVLWWGWAGWTWGTNLVDYEPRWRRVLMLAAMAATFVLAHAVPTAFEGDGLWVAVPYLIMTQLALHTFVDHTFAIALVCFFGAMAAGAWRSNRVVLTERLIAVAASLVVIYGLSDLNGRAVVAVVIVLLLTAFTAEHFRLSRRRESLVAS